MAPLLQVFGLLNFALMPFILIWRIVVFIFENAGASQLVSRCRYHKTP